MSKIYWNNLDQEIVNKIQSSSLEGAVKSINHQIPDAEGNVELSFPKEYRYVDIIPPTEPESKYESGTTAFIAYFERATMPDWAASFNNPDIPDGDMMVVTYKHNNGKQHCIQDVDMFRDGIFTTQFSRCWDYTSGKWMPLTEVRDVRSVNGIKPDKNGNIAISKIDGSKWYIGTGAPTSAIGKDGDLYLDDSTYNIWENQGTVWQDTQVNLKGADGARGLQGIQGIDGKNGKDGAKWFFGSENPNELSLNANVDDMYIQYGDGNIWYKTETDWHYNNGNVRGNKWYTFTTTPPNNGLKTGDLALKSDGTVWRHEGNVWSDTGINLKGSEADVTIANNLTTTVVGSALDATQGKILKDALDLHELKKTAIDSLGHVMIDENTIIADQDGRISVDFSPIADELSVMEGELSQTTSQLLNTKNTLDSHITQTASKTELGHVKVDGTTITADAQGVISAIIPESTETYTFDDSKHINTGRDYFIDGVTITKIPKSTTYHQSVTNILNTQLGWTAIPTDYAFDYILHTSKNGVSGMQTLYVYYYNFEHYYLMGKLTRTTAGTSLGWSLKWTAETIVFNHVPTANSEPLGMFGMLKLDTSTGKLYRSTAKTTPQPNSWFEVEPKMVNSLNQAVQGYALDASQGYVLKGLIDNHESTIASNTQLGHVKVDGNTIEINANGVIGINTTTFRPNKWYVGTDRYGITDAIDGDYYLDTTDGKLYQSIDNVWEDLGGSLFPSGYKIEKEYFKIYLDGHEPEAPFAIPWSKYNGADVEYYEEGRLIPNTDYTLNYSSSTEYLFVEFINPVPRADLNAFIKLTKIKAM